MISKFTLVVFILSLLVGLPFFFGLLSQGLNEFTSYNCNDISHEECLWKGRILRTSFFLIFPLMSFLLLGLNVAGYVRLKHHKGLKGKTISVIGILMSSLLSLFGVLFLLVPILGIGPR